jgi:hypothetical protein
VASAVLGVVAVAIALRASFEAGSSLDELRRATAPPPDGADA